MSVQSKHLRREGYYRNLLKKTFHNTAKKAKNRSFELIINKLLFKISAVCRMKKIRIGFQHFAEQSVIIGTLREPEVNFRSKPPQTTQKRENELFSLIIDEL